MSTLEEKKPTIAKKAIETKKVYNVYLFGATTYPIAKDLISEINKANLEPEKYSHILITSCCGGGDFFPSFSMFDAITNSKLPVDFLASGWVASCAVMIMQAARKRYATVNSYIMVHPSLNTIGTKTHEEFMVSAKQYDLEHKKFITLSSERSGMSYEEFETITKKHMRIYLTPEEALKFGPHGLIDEIIK
jgi:ATP-dependent protease ClpP protease subunit